MNRNVVLLGLVLVATLLIAATTGCQPAAPDTNLNATVATASPAKAFDPAAIETEVMKLAREWAASAESHNPETVRRILADDVVLVYPDGALATKADEVRLIESGAITADSWEMLDTKVTVLNADTAFITGRSVVKNAKYKDPNATKPVDISGEYRFLDVYARRGDRWQVIASQATKVANPTPAASPSPSPRASGSPASSTASPAATRAASPTP